MKTTMAEIAWVGVCMFAGVGAGHIAWLINSHFEHNGILSAFVQIIMMFIVCTMLIVSCAV